MKLNLEARLASLLLQAVSALANPRQNGYLIDNEFMKEADETLNEHFSANEILIIEEE